MVDRPAVALLVAALLAGATACKKPPPSPPPEENAKPKDHLAEREFAEGTEKAFALILPRDSQVVYRITGVVEVESRLLPEELSNYVRAHVKTTKVFAGAETTTFEDAVLPSEPRRQLQIDIRQTHRNTMRSSMTVRDMTPPPPAPKISEEDAYRKAGRTPDGKPLEKHLF